MLLSTLHGDRHISSSRPGLLWGEKKKTGEVDWTTEKSLTRLIVLIVFRAARMGVEGLAAAEHVPVTAQAAREGRTWEGDCNSVSEVNLVSLTDSNSDHHL
jgi:hypothetical protein